jgi:putative peptidoglycan lipid II flippase
MSVSEKFHMFMTAYNRWKDASVNRSILGATFVVAVITAVAKLLFFTKELAVAWRFGTSDLLDAFLIAYVVPSFIVNLISGAFSGALVPNYIQVREQDGSSKANELYASVMSISAFFLLICTGLMILFAPGYLQILASGFDDAKLRLTRNLLYFVSPIIVLSGITTLRTAVINAGEKFAIPALIPGVTPVLTILFIWFAGDIWNIYALVLGMIAGQILEAILLGLFLKKRGIRKSFGWYGFTENLQQVIRQFIPMTAGAFLTGSSILVDQAMAASLASGSVAILNYGNKVISFPLQIAATAISTAVLPYFSTMLARQDWPGAYNTLRHSLKLILLVTIPLTLLLVIFSRPLVGMLLLRGAFTSDNVDIVANVQALGALQIPFYLGGILVVRMLSAMRANHVIVWISLINVIINIVADYILMKLYGVAGISLSTSIVYFCSFSMLLFCVLNIFRKVQTSQDL